MTIGVLDSGIGGVAVLKELLRLPIKNRYIFFADNRYAPYGGLNEAVLLRRVLEIAELLVKRGAEAILLLCNTATIVCIDALRAALTVPVYGVRPDVSGLKGKTLVLSTMLTANRLLKERGASGGTEILGLRSLSLEIEEAAPDFSSLKPYLKTLLAPYRSFRTVCLACTHYIHLAPLIREMMPNAALRSGVEPLIESVTELCSARADCMETSSRTDPRSYKSAREIAAATARTGSEKSTYAPNCGAEAGCKTIPNCGVKEGFETLPHFGSEVGIGTIANSGAEAGCDTTPHCGGKVCFKTPSDCGAEVGCDAAPNCGAEAGCETIPNCGAEVEFIFSGESKEKLYRGILFGR